MTYCDHTPTTGPELNVGDLVPIVLAVPFLDTFIPVGVAMVEMGAEEPDTPFAMQKWDWGCGHSVWIAVADSAKEFVEKLHEYVLWRGEHSKPLGGQLVDWVIKNAHGMTVH